MENELQTTLNNILTDKNTNLKPENLKAGITCLGIEGNMQSGIDTSDANATASEIKLGKTAYVNGEKITGTLDEVTFTSFATGVNVELLADYNQVRFISEDIGTDNLPIILPKNAGLALDTPYNNVANAIGLTPEKLAKGNNILGVEGTAETGGTDTSDANATANDIVQDKTAYVNGEKITGVIPEYKSNTELGEQYFIASKFEKTGDGSGLLISGHNSADGLFRAGTYLGVNIGTEEQSQLAALIGLTPEKIKSGETILGITGTYTGEATE